MWGFLPTPGLYPFLWIPATLPTCFIILSSCICKMVAQISVDSCVVFDSGTFAIIKKYFWRDDGTDTRDRNGFMHIYHRRMTKRNIWNSMFQIRHWFKPISKTDVDASRTIKLQQKLLFMSYIATNVNQFHYNDVIMGAIASQITSLTIVFSTFYSDADQRKHQSSASLVFVPGIHREPVNSPH